MGSIIKMKCTGCEYEKELFWGAGMMDYQDFGRNRTKRAILNGEYGEEVKKALKKHPKAKVYRSNELFHCECCGTYHLESHVQLFRTKRFLCRQKSRFLISSAHACGICGQEMVHVKEKHNNS